MTNVFGDNLRLLCGRRPSIASVARDLEISKVQFNRYLNGESHPKPPVLQRICSYFDVDGRILLEPLDVVERRRAEEAAVSRMPDGFYAYSALAMRLPGHLLRSLTLFWTEGDRQFMRWHYPAKVRAQMLYNRYDHSRLGAVEILPASDGFCTLMPEPGGRSRIFIFWSRDRAMEDPVYTGFTSIGMEEVNGVRRAARVMFVPVDGGFGAVRRQARDGNVVPVGEATLQERMFLRPDDSFT